jgi:hypothetical protein
LGNKPLSLSLLEQHEVHASTLEVLSHVFSFEKLATAFETRPFLQVTLKPDPNKDRDKMETV